LSSLDDLFDFIKNGERHGIRELSEKLRIPQDKMVDMSKFLSQKGLIEFNERDRWVRIQPKWRSILFEEEIEEAKPAIGTLIIPPRQTITIQKVQISNESDVAVELGISVEREILKLAITRME
jgi:hypothetical protein